MIYVKTPVGRADRTTAGEEIIKVSATAMQKSAGPAKTPWQVFDEDPAAALHRWGYRLVSTNAPGDPPVPANGTIPSNLLRIVPVYDTPHTMHVRVPWHGFIDRSVVPPNEFSDYEGSLPAFLASYFTRHCR